MLFIQHRVNRVNEIPNVPTDYGVEFDVRSNQGAIHLAHDPHVDGDSFASYIKAVRERDLQGPLAINTKEDGLEPEILAILKQNHLDNFFFLDLAMPTLIRLTHVDGIKNVAVRVSTYEPVESAMPFKNKASWIWLDCFDGKPADVAIAKVLAPHFKICLVSPELQRASASTIPAFKPLIPFATAVCTKHPELWR